jgi:hypothetical protein
LRQRACALAASGSRNWPRKFEESTAFILLVGEKLGDWQVMEYHEALDRRAEEPDYPII